MANMKWLALMLLIIICNLGFLTIFLTKSLNENQEGCVITTNRIVKNPFASSLRKYLEQNGMVSTGKVAVEFSAQDQKINIIWSIAHNYGIPLAFSSKIDTVTPRVQLRKESSTSGMNVAHKNTMQLTNSLNQEFIPSPQMTSSPDLKTLSARVKREQTNLKMNFKRENTHQSITKVDIKSSPQTMESSTGGILEEATIQQTTPVEELSSPNDRSVREASTPMSQEETTTSQVDKETYVAPSQTILLSESTPSARISRKVPTESGLSKKQKTTFYRFLRVLSRPLAQTIVLQEVTTPTNRVVSEVSTDSKMGIKHEITPSIGRRIREAITSIPKMTDETTTPNGEDDTELSTLDLNLITTIPPRIARYAPILNQEVTKPSSRVSLETLNRKKRNDKEEKTPSDQDYPYSKETKVLEEFLKNTFTPIIDGFKQIKLQGMKKIFDYDDDDFTFPPPTDPEGIDF